MKEGRYMSQQTETAVDKEVDDFLEQLEKFTSSLSEKDQKQLAALVVLATDNQDEATKNVSGKTSTPSEDEIDAFAKKLNEFHDSLPGEQHKILDALVGRAVARDESEVQGQEYVDPWGRTGYNFWIPANKRSWNKWAAWCDYIGGDLESFKTSWGSGRKWRQVGCWVGE
jgi:hypothetical protein